MREIPDHLRFRPFSLREAEAQGLTRRVLAHHRFVQLFRGVYACADVDQNSAFWLHAALLAGPADAVGSHVTALRHHGYDIPGDGKLHLSTRRNAVCQDPRIYVHRRLHPIAVREVAGLRVTSPLRTFVDCALTLPHIQTVMVAEWMINERLVTLDELMNYSYEHHLDGVVAAREALEMAVDQAESPRESMVRMIIVTAGLPEPVSNLPIFGHDGREDFRLDLSYPDLMVAIEYDGAWHESTPATRRETRNRRERLEALGWRVIVIVAADLNSPGVIISRVYGAMVDQGHQGARPFLGADWNEAVQAALRLTRGTRAWHIERRRAAERARDV